MKTLIAMILLLTLTGCSTTKAVKKRASFDLNCAEKDVKVQDIGSGGWGAIGCNKRTSYYCIGGGINPVRCQKNSENVKK